jgi:hypothetical protein
MWFLKEKKISKVRRNFSTPYFKNSKVQEEFEFNGYVILKNIINDTEIKEIEIFFEKLKKLPSYNVKDIFESSGNFICKDTQKLIFDFVESFMYKIADRFVILDNCDIGDGGTFFIKPTTKTSTLHPHQDSTVIDELNTYGIFVWIPLIDINDQNGALCVIPRSHTWGNIHRSQHIPWAFRKQYKFLWNYMLPLYINKGDIICFDTSIIHASGINYTDNERVAICGAIFEKNHTKVEYQIKGKEMRKYYVSKDYWLDGGQAKNLDNFKSEIIKNEFPNSISKKQILQLLNS